jgi:hypothetical protein
MFGAVAGVAHGLDALDTHPAASLVIQVVAGGAVYVASALVLVRESSLELVRLARRAVRRKDAP